MKHNKKIETYRFIFSTIICILVMVIISMTFEVHLFIKFTILVIVGVIFNKLFDMFINKKQENS